MKKNSPSESFEQETTFKWARANQIKFPDLQLLNGSLNGFKLSTGQAVKAKKQGMRKGYPDISLPVPKNHWHGLFIEMKKENGGSVSKEQRTWINKLLDNGYYAVVCRGHKEAIETIKIYLGI
jgi:hypothetical protein